MENRERAAQDAKEIRGMDQRPLALKRKIFVYVVLLANALLWFLMGVTAWLSREADSSCPVILALGLANFGAAFIVMWGFRTPGEFLK
jgi:hypothetical protein